MMMSAPPQPQPVTGTRPAVQEPMVAPDLIPQQVNPQGIPYTIENGNGVPPQQLEADKSVVLGGGNNNGSFTQNNVNPHSGPDENGEENNLVQEGQEQENSEAGATEEINSDCSGDGEVVKLFVGQVPRTMEEADLFPIFEKYGPMQDVAIIRDKHTGQHRGCAFVTFFSKDSADACEKELHNQYTFEGGKRAVQIRPAGRKDEIENKVFVGMLPRNVAEETVRELFAPFGEIKGIFLIRSSDGIKKGCAFVKYTERDSAMAAIQSLHGAVALENSDRPLIVKIADTKNQKKQRQTQNNSLFSGHENPMSHSPQGSFNGNMYYMTAPGPTGHVPHPHLFPGQLPGHVAPNLMSSNTSPGGSYSSGQYPPSFHGAGTNAPPPSYIYQQVHHYDAGSHYNERVRASQQGNQRPREGPAGANLFIYHLPHDLTDADLATAFNPFGNVISAKVYVDRFTGESKGFGFVSYDSIISAEHAIEQMNGFQIGNKRLKVQHKRVNHRPPVSVPAMHHPYYHAHNGRMSQMPTQMPYHDVPPAIEISGPSVGVDNAYSSGHVVNHALVQPDFSQQDMNGLTTQFDSLNTSEQRKGDEHQQQQQI